MGGEQPRSTCASRDAEHTRVAKQKLGARHARVAPAERHVSCGMTRARRADRATAAAGRASKRPSAIARAEPPGGSEGARRFICPTVALSAGSQAAFACAHLPADAVVHAAVLDLDRQVAALVEPPELRVRRVAALAEGAADRRAGGRVELLADGKRGGHATVARVGHGELGRVQLRGLVAVLARRGVVAREQHRRSAIVWPPARRPAGTDCVTSKHELVSGCFVKACFCVRSIFCAIQSSWISAIAGVSTMVASPSNTESRSAIETVCNGSNGRERSARRAAPSTLLVRASPLHKLGALCGLMTPSSSSDYAISAECGVERHLRHSFRHALLQPDTAAPDRHHVGSERRAASSALFFALHIIRRTHTRRSLYTGFCTLCYIIQTRHAIYSLLWFSSTVHSCYLHGCCSLSHTLCTLSPSHRKYVVEDRPLSQRSLFACAGRERGSHRYDVRPTRTRASTRTKQRPAPLPLSHFLR